MKLGAYLRPSETVEVTIPPNPTLNYRDLLMIARAQAGAGGGYRASKWTLPLPEEGKAPGLMRVTTMSRQVDR